MSSNLQFDEDGNLIVDVDGCCFNNNNPNPQTRKAGFGVFFNYHHPMNSWGPLDYNVEPTNNNAEIQAAIEALETCLNEGYYDVVLRTDSAFLHNSINKWMHMWRKNNFHNLNGFPLQNQQKLRELDDLISQMNNVSAIHVQGHSGDWRNEAADELAREGAAWY